MVPGDVDTVGQVSFERQSGRDFLVASITARDPKRTCGRGLLAILQALDVKHATERALAALIWRAQSEGMRIEHAADDARGIKFGILGHRTAGACHRKVQAECAMIDSPVLLFGEAARHEIGVSSGGQSLAFARRDCPREMAPAQGRCRGRWPLMSQGGLPFAWTLHVQSPPRRPGWLSGDRTNHRRRRRSPVFSTWLAIQRRGSVCQRWRSFSNFYFDVGKRPSWRHLLIRDDPILCQAMRDGGLRRGIDGRDRRPGPRC
jgi:hypothetical protein